MDDPYTLVPRILANQGWTHRVLYGLMVVSCLKLTLMALVCWIVYRATRRQDAATAALLKAAAETKALNRTAQAQNDKLEVLLRVVQAEGAVTDAQKARAERAQEKTEAVLVELQHAVPKVAEAVQQVLTAMPAAGSQTTPGEGTIRTLGDSQPVPVVVVNRPSDPVPVAQAADEGKPTK
jgi:endonuclease/exonuclease/phosphatase (EEP) superfamily protein YafD